MMSYGFCCYFKMILGWILESFRGRAMKAAEKTSGLEMGDGGVGCDPVEIDY